MDDEIKDYVDQVISENGLYVIQQKTRELLNKLKSLNSKNEDIINKINMCEDIISYILLVQRDNKLKELLWERKIYSFFEFNSLRFV